MENPCCGDPTGQRTVDVEILCAHRVDDLHLGHYRRGAFVGGPHGGVTVFVDEAGNSGHSSAVDNLNPVGCAQVSSDCPDYAVPDQNGCVLQDLSSRGPDCVDVLNEQICTGNIHCSGFDLHLPLSACRNGKDG